MIFEKQIVGSKGYEISAKGAQGWAIGHLPGSGCASAAGLVVCVEPLSTSSATDDTIEHLKFLRLENG